MDIKDKTCCFSGHRDIPLEHYSEIRKKTKEAVISLIGQGVIYFGTGGAIGYDTIAAKTVLALKRKYPQIKLILVLPCADQTLFWNDRQKRIYEGIKAQADKVRILSEKYYHGCMLEADRYRVDNSSYCVCYCTKSHGGTAYTVDYAEKKGINVIRI